MEKYMQFYFYEITAFGGIGVGQAALHLLKNLVNASKNIPDSQDENIHCPSLTFILFPHPFVPNALKFGHY